MAASDRADSGGDLANREYDDRISDIYDAAQVSINYAEERDLVIQEDNRLTVVFFNELNWIRELSKFPL